MTDERHANWKDIDNEDDLLPDELKHRRTQLEGLAQQGSFPSFGVGMSLASQRDGFASELDNLGRLSPLEKDLADNTKVFIKQKRDILESFVGLEMRNIYRAQLEDGQNIARIEEEKRGLMGRFLLGHWRSYAIQIWNRHSGLEFQIHHPFCFWLDRFDVTTRQGNKLGTIVQRFSFLFRKMDVLDASGNLAFTVTSSPFHPWTFHFFRDETSQKPIATLLKRFPGFFSFFFTDADDFEIQFRERLTPEERSIIFCAAVAIDLTYFEKKA